MVRINTVFEVLFISILLTGCPQATENEIVEINANHRPTTNSAPTPPKGRSNDDEFLHVRKKRITETDDPCESRLLQRIKLNEGRSTEISELAVFEAEGVTYSIGERYDRLVRFTGSLSPDGNPPPDFVKWLDGIQLDTITVFEFRANGRSALAFRSLISGATGISVRYAQWIVLSGNQMEAFESLSSNPQLIFWDKEEQINFYSIIESEPQVNAGGPWDITHFRLSPSGRSEVIRAERKVDCKASRQR